MKSIPVNPKIVVSIFVIVITLSLLIEILRPHNCNINTTSERPILTTNGISVENQMNFRLRVTRNNMVQFGSVLYGHFLPCRKLIGINVITQGTTLDLDFTLLQLQSDADNDLLYVAGRSEKGSSITAINQESEII